MRFLFICGSVEVGRDGVGDYTRRLSLELVSQGHLVRIIGINDTVTTSVSEKLQASGSQEIEVWRFPSSSTWIDRVCKLERQLNEFQPDWISLQYVPYSFHKKGIPYYFVKSLTCLNKKWHWHIMFHETWLGLSSLSPLKHKIVGYFQRMVAKWMIKTLRPEKITTSNRLYQIVLENATIRASILPLFSNIPLAKQSSDFEQEILQKLDLDHANLQGYIILGIFGSLHKGFDFVKVITEELEKAEAQNKQLLFLSFGRMGNRDEFERLEKIFQEKVSFKVLGELPEVQVSATLNILDLAISCTPFEHIGKSGVYAALRLHNVKVLLPFADKIPELEGEIIKYNDYLHSRPSHKWAVDYLASKFVKFLKNINND
jgi:hypothetical protein